MRENNLLLMQIVTLDGNFLLYSLKGHELMFSKSG